MFGPHLICLFAYKISNKNELRKFYSNCPGWAFSGGFDDKHFELNLLAPAVVYREPGKVETDYFT